VRFPMNALASAVLPAKVKREAFTAKAFSRRIRESDGVNLSIENNKASKLRVEFPDSFEVRQYSL
jgi:hypothetical protein